MNRWNMTLILCFVAGSAQRAEDVPLPAANPSLSQDEIAQGFEPASQVAVMRQS
jgi:hypothetical protein